MIKYLLQRPIAVIMVFLGSVIIGVITYETLPVSLLPDIAIPEITVQVTGENKSMRELENTVVKPIRQQLMQVGKLREIRSETRDGVSILRLKFNFGTNTDLAFIEVNEKIDAAMSGLPRDLPRPRVIKASATDIPVFYLNLSLKEDHPYTATNEEKFLDLSLLAENVVKRRIEQLPEVAMVDITGLMYKQVQIIPNMDLLKSASISLDEIEKALLTNNIEPGSMVVRDGYYEYNIKFASLLRTTEDVKNIYFKKNGNVFQLKDLANVMLVRQPETGLSLINGKRAVTLGIIKQSDDTMDGLKKSLMTTLKDLEQSYPEISFTINRNQTELLDYTISNLQQNLVLGFMLVFIVAFLFLGDVKSPIIIGISMITSLITSFVLFYLFNQSLNIISLSGMILALGMMIDSSIIITDIISQHRMNGFSLQDACIKGTNEVITPILSSTLTTIAVFVPLVFLSGIAGAIFFAQAFAVSVGLLVSYFTGIILLPVLYNIIYSFPSKLKRLENNFKFTQKKADEWVVKWYNKGINAVFGHKTISFIFIIVSIPFCILMFNLMPKTSMPHLDHIETIALLEWNENIHIDENNLRVSQLLKTTEKFTIENAVYVGHRQYLLQKDNNLSPSESQLYFKAKDAKQIETITQHVRSWLKENYPLAVVTFSPPENIFEQIFDTSEPELVAELYPVNRGELPSTQKIRNLQYKLDQKTNETSEGIAFDQQYVVSIDREKLSLYGVDQKELRRTLETAFGDRKITTLRSYQQYLPIVLSGKRQTIENVLQETLIRTHLTNSDHSEMIPLHALVKIHKSEDVKTIVAGKNGEYIPVAYPKPSNPSKTMQYIKEEIQQNKDWDVMFSGAFFSNQKMLDDLVIILLISILLMYFILAAQFESFLQPLIVLTEIPIDIGIALLLLWITGNTLNLMSAIGLIVTTGIIINDSILKLDMINELRKDGVELLEAIHIAGTKRLRAIVMTSLTTIFAMVPILFSFDLGSELQKPLAIAMIGTMIIGVVVSLFFVPLVYWSIYKKQDITQ